MIDKICQPGPKNQVVIAEGEVKIDSWGQVITIGNKRVETIINRIENNLGKKIKIILEEK